MEKIYITKEGKEKIYSEYLLVDREIVDLNKKMGESVKLDNDLRENPEFLNLRVRAMYELPNKKKELWNKYEQAIVIEDMEEYHNFDGETVIRGVVVRLNFDGEEEEYRIVGTNEGDLSKNALSCNAPIANALLGKKVGEKVNFNEGNIDILEVRLNDSGV